jgi:hypothetical protein
LLDYRRSGHATALRESTDPDQPLEHTGIEGNAGGDTEADGID